MVTDFTVSDRLERSLEAAMETVADTTGFPPDHHRLDLLGRCAVLSLAARRPRHHLPGSRPP